MLDSLSDFELKQVVIEPTFLRFPRRKHKQGAGIAPENWEAGEIPALPPQR